MIKILSSLTINYFKDILTDTDIQEEYLIQVRIEKFKNYPSVLVMSKTNSKKSKFAFILVKKDHAAPLIINLNASKTSQKRDVPTSIINKNIDMFFRCSLLINAFRNLHFVII